MITPLIQRAQLLYQQGRFDLAADSLRETLAQSPQNGYAHALLGLCLVRQNKYDDATHEAQAAIHQEPDSAFCHYALGVIFQERNRFDEAETSAREAVRLAPEDPDYWSLLGQTFISRSRWKDALDAANHGLQVDPEHVNCINLRAVALVKLGDRQLAAQSIEETLRRNPHDALSHANQGWNYLHQSKPREALEHFREALRLDPNNAWAREGTIAALKARHFLYRVMLRYYLWMSRFSNQGRWAIVIGMWVGIQLLRVVKESNPALGVVVYPLLVAYGVFVISSWLADPIFNLTLLVNPFGRYLLNRVKIISALLIGAMLLAALILIPLGYYLESDVVLVPGLLVGFLTLPVTATSKCRVGRPMLIMTAYTLVVAGAGIAGIVFMVMNDPRQMNCFFAAVWGCILSSFAANILLSMVEKK